MLVKIFVELKIKKALGLTNASYQFFNMIISSLPDLKPLQNRMSPEFHNMRYC